MMKSLLIAASVCVGMASVGLAADKPNELKIGITTFTSGPASVFGVPGKASAELIVEEWNRKGGIGGVPVKLFFVDEGAGTQAMLAEYRRLWNERLDRLDDYLQELQAKEKKNARRK